MVANALSMLRIILVAPLIYSLFQADGATSPITLGLLALAAISDLADGYLARRLGQTSRLGKILDPLADKIFLGGLGIALTLRYNFPLWLAVMLVVRDLVILLAGFFLLWTHDLVIPANRFGKYTTACLTVVALIHLFPVSPSLRNWLTYLAGLMLLVSSLSYARLMRRTLDKG